MRQEPARILGDQAVVFAHANPGRLITDYPRTDQRVAVVELRQRGKFLQDEGRVGVGPILFDDQAFGGLQLDVGAFPGEERFANPALGHRAARIRVKVRGQQIRVALVQLP